MAIGPGSGGMRLRPLDIGDVLDETFRIYRRRFVPIVKTMAVVVVPSSLLSLEGELAAGVLSVAGPAAGRPEHPADAERPDSHLPRHPVRLLHRPGLGARLPGHHA